MPPNLNRTMQEAMQLMQSGDLQAATRAIQRGLHAVASGQGAGDEQRLFALPAELPVEVDRADRAERGQWADHDDRRAG